MQRRPLAGIFVGGASLRMGGRAKGLLRLANGELLVDRWRRLFDDMDIESILVGSRAEYAPRETLADEVDGTGPLGGLVALLRRAIRAVEHATPSGPVWVLAVACDMPHVSRALVTRLLEAPYAVASAPRRAGRWEPMLARYDARCALPVATSRCARGVHSMQGLLEELAAAEVALSPIEAMELDDWDTVEDVERRPA